MWSVQICTIFQKLLFLKLSSGGFKLKKCIRRLLQLSFWFFFLISKATTCSALRYIQFQNAELWPQQKNVFTTDFKKHPMTVRRYFLLFETLKLPSKASVSGGDLGVKGILLKIGLPCRTSLTREDFRVCHPYPERTSV